MISRASSGSYVEYERILRSNSCMRWYDIEVDLEGSANGSFCKVASADECLGPYISDLYDGNGQFTFIGSCNTDNHITYTAATVDADTPSAVVGALQAPESAKADGNIG